MQRTYDRHLRDVVERRSDHKALIYLRDGEPDGRTRELTYAQLDARARAIAARLTAQGLRGKTVLLVFNPGTEFVAAFVGCLYAGAIAVPAYPPDPSRVERTLPRFQAVTAACGASHALVSTSIAPMAKMFAAQTPGLQHLTWYGLAEITDDEAVGWTPPDLSPEDPAFLQFTSGSTGTPRGVVITHRTLVANQRMLAEKADGTEDDVCVNWVPFYHDLGLLGGIMLALYMGATSVLLSPVHFLQRPARWMRALSHYRGTLSSGPNFSYDLTVRRTTPEERVDWDLSAWRAGVIGGEPVRAETLRTFADAFAGCGVELRNIVPGYGMAECVLTAASPWLHLPRRILTVDPAALRAGQVVDVDDPAAQEVVSHGPPNNGCEICVVDPDTREPLGDDRVGEIWIRGPHVAAGYWNDPEASAEVFGATRADGEDGWLRSGDLGFLRDGELYPTGRIKDLVILRGQNHHPHDLEATVAAASARVRPGSVAAYADDDGTRERLVVLLEVRDPSLDADTAATLFDTLAAAIADQHGIEVDHDAIVPKNGIPKTSSGKLRRRAARASYDDERLVPLHTWTATRRPTRPVEPDGGWLSWILTNLGEVLERPVSDDDLHTPFGALGLGSVRALELAALLEDAAGVEIPPTLLFDHPTPADLARWLSDETPDPTPSWRLADADAPLALVGMGLRMPAGIDPPDALWELLAAGRDATGPLPLDRWEVGELYDPDPAARGRTTARGGCFLRDIDQFDAAFFGISPTEARELDPQQRLVMEAAWEAFERAGIDPTTLDDQPVGVYLGTVGSDYAYGRPLNALSGHVGTGNLASVLSGRVAFHLGLSGPAVTLDTACSSSLVALHLAAQAIRSGDCDVALAGGVTVMTTANTLVEFSRLDGHSPDGRCRAFSDDADGLGWAEGAVVYVVEPLARAEALGHPVLAILRGSAINQDGRSHRLSAPNGTAQQAVVRKALAAAGLAPDAVDYVETHGPGTPLGDPIEADALASVFGSGTRGQPLGIGSIKSNVAHMQAAAGAAGLAKVLLSLAHDQLPATLHVRAPTPLVPWERGQLELLSGGRPWPRGDRPRIAGVSGFGISGTNAHLVVEEPPAGDPTPSDVHTPVLVLSAATPDALRAQAARWADRLDDPTLPWADVLHTAARRAQLRERLALPARDRDATLAMLRTLAADGAVGLAAQGRAPARSQKVAFLFPGQGSQRVGAAAGLQHLPAFADAVEDCLAILEPIIDTDQIRLRELLFDPEQDPAVLARTRFTQPFVFCLAWGLANQWKAWGVQPDLVGGHSFGELVAAVLAGVLTLPEALSFVTVRAFVAADMDDGAMAAVPLDEDAVLARLDRFPGVAIAALNGPGRTTITGPAPVMTDLLDELEAEGHDVRRLAIEGAFHSPAVDPVLPRLQAAADAMVPQPARLPFADCVRGRMDNDWTDPSYWVRQTRAPVRFADTVRALHDAGATVFVELGAMAVLSALGSRILEDVTWIASLPRDAGHAVDALSLAWGRAHVAGVAIDRAAAFPGRVVALPTYAFQRQSYWRDSRLRAGGGERAHAHPVLHAVRDLPDGELSLHGSVPAGGGPYADHVVRGTPLLPGAGAAELLLQGAH